jgi:hypothetical protein
MELPSRVAGKGNRLQNEHRDQVSQGTSNAVARELSVKEGRKVLSDSVIAKRGRVGSSPCRSCAAPSSKTTSDFESYIALDQSLESQRDARERRSGFEGNTFLIESERSRHRLILNGREVATFTTLEAAEAEASKIAKHAVPGATLRFELDFKWTLSDLEIRAARLKSESGKETQ